MFVLWTCLWPLAHLWSFGFRNSLGASGYAIRSFRWALELLFLSSVFPFCDFLLVEFSRIIST